MLLVIASGSVFALSRTLALGLDRARAEFEARIEALTGLPVSVEGRTTLTLLPRARLDLAGVRIGPDPEHPLLSVDAVTADLDLWQALVGRLAMERLVLVRPELRADGLQPPRREVLARRLEALMRDLGGSSRIETRDGVLRLPMPHGDIRVSSANLALSWRGAAGPMRLAGTYVWKGEPAELDLRLAAPIALLDGGASAVEASFEAPPLQFTLSGAGSLAATTRFQGRITAATPSLPRIVRWIGGAQRPPPDFGALSIEADLSAIDRRLALRNARVSVGPSSGQGALEMQMPPGGRPVVGGTLAFEQLDVAGLAEALAPLPDNPLAWVRPLQLDVFDDLDLDLRLSAALAVVGQTPVTDIAATLRLKGGQASLDLGDATLLGGRAQARATLIPDEGQPRLEGSGSLAGVDAQGLAALLDIRALGITGRADLSVSLASPLRRFADLAQGASAKIGLVVRGGTLAGIAEAPFVTPGERRLAPSGEEPSLAFERLSAKLHSTGPRLAIDALTIDRTDGQFAASGLVALDTGRVDVAGTFQPHPALAAADPTETFTSAQPTRFKMEGLWPAPDVVTGPPQP